MTSLCSYFVFTVFCLFLDIDKSKSFKIVILTNTYIYLYFCIYIKDILTFILIPISIPLSRSSNAVPTSTFSILTKQHFGCLITELHFCLNFGIWPNNFNSYNSVFIYLIYDNMVNIYQRYSGIPDYFLSPIVSSKWIKNI